MDSLSWIHNKRALIELRVSFFHSVDMITIMDRFAPRLGLRFSSKCMSIKLTSARILYSQIPDGLGQVMPISWLEGFYF